MGVATRRTIVLCFLLADCAPAFPAGPAVVASHVDGFCVAAVRRIASFLFEPRQIASADAPLDLFTLPRETLAVIRGNKEISVARIRRLVEMLPTDPDSEVMHAERLKELEALRDAGRLRDPRKLEMLLALELRAGKTHEEVEDRRQQLIARLSSEDPYARLDAVLALRAGRGAKTRGLLEKAVGDSDYRVRNAARLGLLDRGAFVLGDRDVADIVKGIADEARTGPGDAYDQLAYLSEPDLGRILETPGVAANLKRWMGNPLLNRNTPLITRYLMDGDPELRAMAVHALTFRFEPGVDPLLRTMARDSDPRVLERVADALRERPDPDSQALLAALLQQRSVDFKAGHEIIPASAREWVRSDRVEAMLTQPDEATQIEAAVLLPRQSTRLIELALSSPFPKVRVLAAKALVNRQDPEAVRLMEQAFGDPVVEVRLAAVGVAQGMKDPRAAAILKKALGDSHRRVYAYAHEIRELKSRWGSLPLAAPRPTVKDVSIEALEAAGNVYNVPEPNRGVGPKELVDRYEKFREGVPLGYEVAATVAEARTGLKFAYYTPEMESKPRPLIFSIGGTQGYTDLLADLNLGAAQRKSPVLLQMEERLVRDVLSGRDIVITGHSLGGGLAQAVAYDLAKAVEGKPGAGKVLLVTWNAFGGRELIARTGTFSPEIEARIDAANYYVPGDPVSRIGTHVGPVMALAPIKRGNPIGYHIMDAVEEAAYFKGGVRQPTPGPPTFKFRLSTLSTKFFGWVGDAAQGVRYRFGQRRVVETLMEARIEWARRHGYEELYPGYDWLDGELREIMKEVKASRQTGLQQYIEQKELERQQILAEKRKPAVPAAPQLGS